MAVSNSGAEIRAEAWALEELFSCLSRGDLSGVRACFLPYAVVWHNFDCMALTLDQASKGWASFIDAFPERSFRDVRRLKTNQGFVQQHLTVARDASGIYRTWPTCVVVTMEGQQIVRLDEYLDRAGALQENAKVTPGFAS